MQGFDSFQLTILVPLFLGIIEGLTEFIPVSSTGHLILASRFINLQGQSVGTFEVFIQLGAIMAVLYLYPHRYRALLDWRADNNGGFSGRYGVMLLIVASLPALIVGLLCHGSVKALFNPTNVAAALIVGGLLMILIEKRQRPARVVSVDQITHVDALLIGLFQVLSLWPGMSRSGSTMLGGLFIGVERKIAAEFSFLISVPIMFAAVVYDLYKSRHFLSANEIVPFAIGFLVSFITAVIAIKFFVSILSRFTLIPFALYRIALGSLVLWLVSGGGI